MARNGAVKVTYIETQFVTSDAASFKSLVQRLTGKSAQDTEPASQLHRPSPNRPGADGRSTVTGAPSYYMPATARSASSAADDVRTATAGASRPYLELDDIHWLSDYSELSYVAGASNQRHGASYTDLLY